MPDFDWKNAVATVAPAIATAIGGPAAGLAISALGRVLLGKSDATEDEVAAAVSQGMTGDQLLALKKEDNAFKLEMARIAQESDAAAYADTANARAQTVSLAENGSHIAWAPVVISAIIVIGFFGCVALLFGIERTWDERTANLLNILFGALIPGFSTVTNYWMGSSAGSKRAGDAVRKIAEQATK